MEDFFREKQVFMDALDVAEGERESFLAEACAGWEAAARKRVEAMVAASGSEFLNEPTFVGGEGGGGGLKNSEGLNV